MTTREELDLTPEEDVVISFNNVTKDYGKGRGIFNISFKIPRGKVFGYCGTNGAGKTTTLRHIMGFIKPDSGEVKINGYDPKKAPVDMWKNVGYLPGEIAFPQVESGSDFLKIQASLLGLTDMSKAEKYVNMLQLDPTANLKRMSKGMKQKTAIVAAFMHEPDIILLDEPTTGLDPLMREAFIEILEEAKSRGATILMSNHMFDELDETCDYVGFIGEGKLIDIVDVKKLHNQENRDYIITFNNIKDFEKGLKLKYEQTLSDPDNLIIKYKINVKDSNKFLEELSKLNIKYLKEDKYTLHRYFMENLGGLSTDGNSSN